LLVARDRDFRIGLVQRETSLVDEAIPQQREDHADPQFAEPVRVLLVLVDREFAIGEAVPRVHLAAVRTQRAGDGRAQRIAVVVAAEAGSGVAPEDHVERAIGGEPPALGGLQLRGCLEHLRRVLARGREHDAEREGRL
jgi:hypothetical protein